MKSLSRLPGCDLEAKPWGVMFLRVFEDWGGPWAANWELLIPEMALRAKEPQLDSATTRQAWSKCFPAGVLPQGPQKLRSNQTPPF